MVKTQYFLIEALSIKKLFAVIGGSMGAMQALQWSIDFPEKIHNLIHIAGALKHSAQNIAFHEVGRQAIMNDANWKKGSYIEKKLIPERGLAVARMIAHITYLSDDAMHRKFGRKLQSRDIISFGFDADFQIESYLRYQGRSFVDRFDANSYLYLTRAMDYFDEVQKFSTSIEFPTNQNEHINYLIISFTSDWLFPTSENKEIAKILNFFNRNISFTEIETDKGHDSFLLDEPELDLSINGFLDSNFKKL
jgi:homoserine O-acetyltransferase